MGLDMNLIGYWRKHPNLHRYFVNEFAEGNDDCLEMEIRTGGLRKVIDAVKHSALPHTEGFFFGESDGAGTENDLLILEGALAWLEAGDER